MEAFSTRPEATSRKPRRRTRQPLALTGLIALTLLACASPGQLQADWHSGVEAFQNGEWTAAEKEFRLVVEEKPDWYGGHLMLGQTYLHLARYGDAIPRLKKAVEMQPESSSTRLALAQAAIRGKRDALVLEALAPMDLEALDGATQKAAFRLLGQASFRLKDYSAAASFLVRAIELAPDDSVLRLLSAKVSLELGRPDDAVRELEAARSLEPDDRQILTALTQARWNQLVRLSGDARRLACEAAAHEARALDDGDLEASTLLLLGRLELCAEALSRAEALLARGAALGEDWRAPFYLARIRALQERWEEAEATLDSLRERELPSTAAIKVASLLGSVYENQERFELAVEQYAQTGEAQKVSRARKSLETQRRNAEIERLRTELEQTTRCTLDPADLCLDPEG